MDGSNSSKLFPKSNVSNKLNLLVLLILFVDEFFEGEVVATGLLGTPEELEKLFANIETTVF